MRVEVDEPATDTSADVPVIVPASDSASPTVSMAGAEAPGTTCVACGAPSAGAYRCAACAKTAVKGPQPAAWERPAPAPSVVVGGLQRLRHRYAPATA